MHLNRGVNLVVKLLAAPNIVGSKPAPHSFVLQVCVKAIREFLVLCRVADETRMELNRLSEQ